MTQLDERFTVKHCDAGVSLNTPTIMFVILTGREVFDAIPLPAETYPHCLVKVQQTPELRTIFQWRPSSQELVLELPSAEEVNERQEQTLCTPA